MAQATRKKRKPAKAKKTSPGLLTSLNSHGIGMLFAGIVIGSLGTTLWQGWRTEDGEVGSGIRRMMEASREQAGQPGQAEPAPVVQPEPRETNYDFFTVLPEIEVVVSEDEPPPPKPSSNQSTKPDDSQAEVREAVAEPASAYMLQAGSFNRESDAERQKASLALLGLTSSIQKVTIQGRGDFFRVRLGPFSSHTRMVEADDRLKREGIRALRLKVSRAGQGA